MRYIKARCRVCGGEVNLSIGGMEPAAAVAALARREGFSCSAGLHVELGPAADYLELERDAAGEPVVREGEEPPTDAEFLADLRARNPGADVLVAASDDLCAALGIPRLHSVPGLVHLGFGDFASPDTEFARVDSPRGTRFYLATPRARRA